MLSRKINTFSITFPLEKEDLIKKDHRDREYFRGEAYSLEKTSILAQARCRYYADKEVLFIHSCGHTWNFRVTKDYIKELIGKRHLRVTGMRRVWSAKE